MSTRKPAKTQLLAEWFVTKVLEQTWDYRFCMRHLAAAKALVNPPKDKEVEPLDPVLIRKTVEALKRGEFNFQGEVNSLYCVTWGTPPFFRQMEDRIKQIPPPYMVRAYDEWFEVYGNLAYSKGWHDGSYLGWGNPLEMEFRLSPLRVAEIVGSR